MIHPAAIVDAAATIADDVSVGPFCVIGPDVSIGAGCRLDSHVVIQGPTRIGSDNRFHAFASIGGDPQDLKYDDERTELEIGDGNTFRESVTISRGTEGGGGVTRIGHRNLFMALVHVAHDCDVADHTVFANGASLAGHCKVGRHAVLAGFACIHQFCEVGEHAFVGLNSVVNRDVAPFTLVVGNYATARGVNRTGLKRRGFDEASIRALHEAYRVLIRQPGERERAIERLGDLPDRMPAVARLVQFVRDSTRGVVR